MLQRKQTLFLLASVVAYVVTYYLPFAYIGSAHISGFAVVDASGADHSDFSLFGFGYVLAVGATLALASIFLYSNRQRQMMVLRLSFIFYAIAFALFAWALLSAGSHFNGASPTFGPAFLLAIASLLLNMIALRFIRKDEKLVRSLDRLR